MLRFKPVGSVLGLDYYGAVKAHWKFIIGHDPSADEYTASWKDRRKDLLPGRTPANYLGGGVDDPFKSWAEAERACEDMARQLTRAN